MAIVTINDENLTNIAAAIREKNGSTDTYKPADMADAIAAITTGGGELPEEALNITGNCYYKFSNDGWNWFIDMYGNQIKTSDLTDCQYMFGSSKGLTKIPFVINLATSGVKLGKMFQHCHGLTEVPKILGTLTTPTGNYSGTIELESIFQHCHVLREIPEDYFNNFGGDAYWTAHKNYQGSRASMFSYCYSLRKLPDISNLGIKSSSYYYSLYYSLCNGCYVLDEVVNLPIEVSTYTSNTFSNTFSSCHRLKDVTFATQEDGTPYSATWSKQTIDLSFYVGYGGASVYAGGDIQVADSNILRYNSGITKDKLVWNDATYQALKDDPDWFTADANYSRYNKTSAVNTINSLPDVSSGSGNTIKFNSTAGSLTDGGAASALTEEEIAVAAAKGWTVTLV